MKVWRILVVEDDASIARAHERMIRRTLPAACEVLVADSAGSAVFLLEHTESFDLVISDYNLESGTGADVLAAIRAMAKPPAFLFVSSDEVVETLGAAFLPKPCAPSALRNAIAAATIGGSL